MTTALQDSAETPNPSPDVEKLIERLRGYSLDPHPLFLESATALERLTAERDTLERCWLAAKRRSYDAHLHIKELEKALEEERAKHRPLPQTNQQIEAAMPNASCTLREQGKPYPRTCTVCGLGPCRRAALTKEEAANV